MQACPPALGFLQRVRGDNTFFFRCFLTEGSGAEEAEACIESLGGEAQIVDLLTAYRQEVHEPLRDEFAIRADWLLSLSVPLLLFGYG